MLEGLQVQQGLLGRRRPPPLGLRQDWGIWLVKRRRWLWCDRPRVTCKLRAGTLKLHGEEAGAGGGDKPLQLPAFPGCLRTRAWLWGFSFWTVDTQCEFQGHRAVTQCLKVTMYLLPLIPPSIRVFSNESSLRIRWPKYWLDLPEITGTSRGNQGFPAPTRKRHRSPLESRRVYLGAHCVA